MITTTTVKMREKINSYLKCSQVIMIKNQKSILIKRMVQIRMMMKMRRMRKQIKTIVTMKINLKIDPMSSMRMTLTNVMSLILKE
jgi:hypothetical protein